MDQTERPAREWRRGCGGFLAACCLIILLGLCAGSTIAAGRIVGPNINMQIGPYHVLSRTTTSPDCHPLSMGCLASNPKPMVDGSAYYTIWVLTLSEQPIAGGVQEHLTSRRIITLPISLK